jgi:hypothetical protein
VQKFSHLDLNIVLTTSYSLEQPEICRKVELVRSIQKKGNRPRNSETSYT